MSTNELLGHGTGMGLEGEFKQRFGSFYRYTDIGKFLGVTRQAVSQKNGDSRILVVTTKDGTKLCPAFQFVNGKVEKPVSDLINTLLGGGMDSWSALYWLTTPLPECDNKTAIEALCAGNGYSAILNRLAREDVAHWAM